MEPLTTRSGEVLLRIEHAVSLHDLAWRGLSEFLVSIWFMLTAVFQRLKRRRASGQAEYLPHEESAGRRTRWVAEGRPGPGRPGSLHSQDPGPSGMMDRPNGFIAGRIL